MKHNLLRLSGIENVLTNLASYIPDSIKYVL